VPQYEELCCKNKSHSPLFLQHNRAFGMRRSRYICVAKTHLQHLGVAAAINMIRVGAWLDGDELAPTRVSAFQRLYNAA